MNQIIFSMIIFSLSASLCLAQNNDKKRSTVVQKNDAVSEQNTKEQDENEQLNKEAAYYSPIRYVIVYNEIFKLSLDERRIKVLMDEKQFNEENLLKVFELVKKRFPLPSRLQIDVHTNLATIETPEENEMARGSLDPRFAHTYTKYKRAFYIRFEDGQESFNYTTNLFPYKEKRVFLTDKKSN